MAPKVTLHYFNLRGRGEPIRLLLSYTGQEWDDHRIEFSEWPAIKSTTPFGQLPYVDVEGRGQLAQTNSICRYLAKQHGLHGSNALEEAQIDALADNVADAGMGYGPYVRALLAKDEKKAKEAGDHFAGTLLKPFMDRWEKILLNNTSGQDYLVGGKPTWADFVLVQLLDETIRLKSDVLEPYPLLKALHGRVLNLKGVKDYLAQRQETPW
ncbi:hypothetical protein RvY_10348-2 [Ramazzottius varieornatus]|uniref:Uncharacterized protein n=1 Tax=Ramazzottius varieornatus TaxID=947166 RepID=A0A1D1VCG4_RAMVA|nr:hypothetical protein RvY_10348-2 [Ramazzottius varieornatus]